MFRNLTFFFVLTSLSGVPSLSAQELTGTAAAQRITGASQVRLETNGTEPTFVVFNPSEAVSIDDIAELQQRISGHRPENTWKLIRSEDDRQGMTHVRYQQQYRQLDVEGQVYIFHAKNGKIVSANGHFVPGIAISTAPVITPEKAFALAAAGMEQPENNEPQLVVLPVNQQPVLAYKCTIFSRQPLVNRIVYIDARNGKVLSEVNRICTTDVPGTATTHFSGTQPIVADQVQNGFLLRESGRGNGIETYDNATQQLYFDADNNWNNANANMDEFAGDVHFGTETTYDFFHDNFGRNSYDNNGGLIRSYVNDIDVGVNAYWSGGGDNTMHYGNGDNNYFPVASLEITGHELSHGVTEYSAGLQYSGESGALNESFSDIFGSTIRFLTTPGTSSWYIGDQLLREVGGGAYAFRNMANPNDFLNPDTYDGQYFHTGDIVHYDSGIQNFWYYLLVEGGTGTNDIGNSYAVNGIGLGDAMQIAYRNLAYYLTPTSTFLDARYGAEQAAADLFGPCSPQQLQTINAWYAVGVGGTEPAFQPVASYTVSNDFACVAPLTTQFSGGGNFDSYHWDFGDGETSTLQNPVHVYDDAAHYTVTLIISNNLACIDPDTLVVPNGIVIDMINPEAAFTTIGIPVPEVSLTFSDQSLYGPVSWEWQFGDGGTSTLQNPAHTYAASGLYNVTLIVHNCHGSDSLTQVVEVDDYFTFCEDTILDSPSGVICDPGGPNGNYPADVNCVLSIRPCNAMLITLTIDEFVMSDSDGIGILDANQLVQMYSGTVPQTTITTTTGIFDIYFFSDEVPEELPGFRISYTTGGEVIPDANSADFLAFPYIGAVGQQVIFADNSEFNPVAWSWTFGDGTVAQGQSPQHAYQFPGLYDVTLTVTYCNGFTDTHTESYYVYDNAGVQELSAGNLLTLYPNPSNGVFTLSANVPVVNAVMSLYDLSGREVYHHEASEVPADGIAIDAGILSNGQYLFETVYELNGSLVLERHKIQVLH